MRLLIIFFLLTFCANCEQNKQSQNTAKLDEMAGKKITFPTDNTLLNQSGFLKVKKPARTNKLALVTFIDGRCTSCIHQASMLEQFRILITQSVNKDLDLIVFVLVNKEEDFKNDYFSETELQRVYLVKNYHFLEMNDIPFEQKFHTFLIDKENRIMLIGHPNMNKKLEKLYLKTVKQYG